MKKWKPRARGRSYPIKRPTCHISIVVKDISLDKYIETFPWLKKPRWKNKDTNMIYHDMDSSGGIWDKKEIHLVSDWVQPKISIPFGLHNQKTIRKV